MAEYGFLIPVYNHGAACLETARLLLPYGLPLIIVDDGSDAETKQALGEAAALSPLVHLVGKAKNGGKGSAVSAGFLTARKMGLDHVLQLDADRQHDISAVPRFLEISHAHPSSLVLGYPIYDASVPESRKKGREVSNVFARIVTCNKDIRDVLCGFRVYPVGPACHVVSHGIWDMRMGFDAEMVVRLCWKQVPIINEGVKVTYPAGGSSHFHMVRDNVRISLVFTRLCFGAFFRLPWLVARRKG